MSSARLSLSSSSAAAADLARALSPQDDLSPLASRTAISLIAGAHILGMWGLLQIDVVRDAAREVAPLMIDLVAPLTPERPPPPPPPPTPTVRAPKPVVEKTLIAAPQ